LIIFLPAALLRGRQSPQFRSATTAMRQYDLDVVVTRGGGIESRHRVHAAVVDARGALIASARDSDIVTMWRSCAKPFQVMPLLESGAFDEMAWGDDELTLACASHGGEPEHIAIAQSMLSDLGLEEGDLACGPHEPLSPRGSRLARESGTRITRLHNNCSGKHAAMLARAHVAGWNRNGYERAEHPVQEGALDAVAKWCEIPREKVLRAIDGCGVVVFGMPISNMARAYARFAAAAAAGDEVPSRILNAICTRPFLFSGTDRFDSIVVEETHGRIIPKIGAEGVHTVAALDQQLGIAIKVEDGALRAQYPAVVRALQYIGVLPERLPPRIAEFTRTRVKNTRGEVVGEVHPVDS
jgi:L-asparaginase II